MGRPIHPIAERSAAQQNLDVLVLAVVTYNYMTVHEDILRLRVCQLLEAGAAVDGPVVDRLFSRTHTNFVDEIQNYGTRAVLFKILRNVVPFDISKYVDWSVGDPVTWSELAAKAPAEIAAVDEDTRRFLYFRHRIFGHYSRDIEPEPLD